MPVYRKPTEQEIAEALRYIEAEFVLEPDGDGKVNLDEIHWIEGLAFGPARVGFPALPQHMTQAREVYPQLSEQVWIGLAASADVERMNQCLSALYTSWRYA